MSTAPGTEVKFAAEGSLYMKLYSSCTAGVGWTVGLGELCE
jgi:hypothetical protein